jgi:hypothetical protein
LELLNEQLLGLAISIVEGENVSPLAAGISGKTYLIQPNSQGIRSISFNFESSPAVIYIKRENAAQSFNVGYHSMEMGSMISPQLTSGNIAVSGAWESPDKYRVKIIYYETPHEIQHTFHFNGDRLWWDSDLNVSFGPTKLERLSGSLQ